MKIKRILISILCVGLLYCQVFSTAYASESRIIYLRSRLRIFDTDKNVEILLTSDEKTDFKNLKVTFEIDNNSYEGIYKGRRFFGDCAIEIRELFSVQLPRSFKAGMPYKITAEYQGYQESISGAIIDSTIIPNVTIDAKPTYQSKYISGTAQENSEVILRIGKQACSIPAKKGKYKLKFDKRYKVGTKFTIICKSLLNDKTKTIKGVIGKPRIAISVPKTIHKTSKKISGKVSGTCGREYIVATIKGKTYKAKIGSNKKFTIKLPKLDAVKKIKLTVYNEFKQTVRSSIIKIHH